MKVTWYGHSCFLIMTEKATLLIDPFLSGNPKAPVSPEQIAPDYILLTHGHGDHVGDTVAIAQRSGAMVLANFEICNWLAQQGVSKCHAQHIGGGFDYPWGRLQLTMALHGSAMPDGSYGGNPCGLLLNMEGKVIYHAGDTGLFSDMKLIGEAGVDLAILPIGDNFTMGPDDALRAVSGSPRSCSSNFLIAKAGTSSPEVVDLEPHPLRHLSGHQAGSQGLGGQGGGGDL